MTRILLVPDLPAEHWPSMDRYASRLVAHLPRAEGMEFEVAGPIARLTDESGDPSAHRAVDTMSAWSPPRLADVGRYVERYVSYPRRVRRHRADVMHILDHSYGHVVAPGGSPPAVVTVHDLFPVLVVKRRASTLRERLRHALLRRTLEGLRRARAWIVSTEWLRTEVQEWLQRDDAVHVIPLGVDEAYFREPAESRDAIRNGLGIPPDRFVVLHVGSVVERKNIAGVFAAVEGLRAKGVDVWLLQVGGRFTDVQQQALAAQNLEPVTTQVPAVQEPALRAAYRAADVLLFPSHYEGFGLPLLEAMASGLPVITSSVPALEEVGGHAAVVVEGRDPAPYTEALLRVAQDPSWATELARRGRDRAHAYRWAETARRTVEVYRSLL